MVMERAERKTSERVSGIPNLTYDLIALLHEKLDAITAYEIYKQDAKDAGHSRASSLIEHCQETDRTIVQHLRKMLAEELGVRVGADGERDATRSTAHAGEVAPLKSEEIVDDASEDSFPASDPPSFSGTTA